VPVTSPQNKIPGLYLSRSMARGATKNTATANKTSVPKVSLRYLPVRTTSSPFARRTPKSFTAPTLYDLYGTVRLRVHHRPWRPERVQLVRCCDRGQVRPLQGYQINGFNSLLTRRMPRARLRRHLLAEVCEGFGNHGRLLRHQANGPDRLARRHHYDGAVGRSVGRGLTVFTSTSR